MTTILLRRGTSAAWASADTVLAAGEPGYDLTTRVLKIGDGVTPWSSLGETADDDIVAELTRLTPAFGDLFKRDLGNETPPTKDPTFLGTSEFANVFIGGSLRQPGGYIAGNPTLTVDSPMEHFVDVTAAARQVTLPATATQPGIRFRIHRFGTGVNALTVLGSFQNPSGNLTNLVLRGVKQWVEVSTSTTSGLFVVLAQSPYVVPAGTSHADQPDGSVYLGYAP